MSSTRACVAAAITAGLCAALAASASALTISPLNGTPDASPHTQISFLGTPATQISDVSVVGSRSGHHRGSLRSYASATGASFLPARGFAEGEHVTVSALVGSRGHTARVGTSFTVARLVDYPLPANAPSPAARAGSNQSFRSQPKLQPPTVSVTSSPSAASDSDIFLTTDANYGQSGAMIINSAGRLIWFQPAASGDDIENLQVQSYGGKPVLTYWQGHVDLGVGFGSDEVLSSDYRPVASINAGNGYQADLHELNLTPQGSAYLTAYTLVRADLSSVGGSRDGALEDAVVQELDVKTGLVMFEWHADGHVAITDSHSAPPRNQNLPWDFFHVNSISPDPWGDGNLLISARNTWAAYEINHENGAVLWRLGGKRSSFRMGPGTGTAYQHDVSWQPDHTITIFDNGATPKAHSQSRAIHVRINWKQRTVELIGRDVRSPSLLSGSQGDDQLQPNGNVFVGWGEAPFFTEFDSAGQIVLDGHLPPPAQAYRTLRFPWSATPATPPSIALKNEASSTTVYASWNGATGVAAWRVLAGQTPATLQAVAEAPASGFEIAIPTDSTEPVFAVQALGEDGEVLANSHVIAR